MEAKRRRRSRATAARGIVGVLGVVLLALTLVGCDFQVGTKTGELDPGFGGGDGFVTFAGRARSDDDADVAARQPDGKVVVLAHQEGRNLLVRQLPDGSLDPSFGDGGVAAVDLPFGLVRQSTSRVRSLPMSSFRSIIAARLTLVNSRYAVTVPSSASRRTIASSTPSGMSRNPR